MQNHETYEISRIFAPSTLQLFCCLIQHFQKSPLTCRHAKGEICCCPGESSSWLIFSELTWKIKLMKALQTLFFELRLTGHDKDFFHICSLKSTIFHFFQHISLERFHVTDVTFGEKISSIFLNILALA